MKTPRITNLKPRIATLDTRTAKPLPKEADDHYGTPEHRAWAVAVKNRARWQCEHIENGERCRNRHPTSRMYAGHIKNQIDYPDLALDLNNGRCECNSHNTKGGIQDRALRLARKA
jgi:5-methylcytosine-specific restriction protein A